jgi:hypothetical protein
MAGSDDLIYQAAQQAGLMDAPDTVSSGDDQATPSGNTEYTSPTQAPPAQSTANPPGSIGVSQSQHGFSPEKYKQVSGTTGQLNQDLAAAEAQGAQEKATETGILDRGRQKAESAANAVGTAGANIESAKGHEAALQQHILDGFAQEEAKINEHYRSEANQVKADYMAALADFRSSHINPDQLWEQGGKSGQIGTLAAVFMHDFLGARGIQTSAMDTINRSIDRNMQAQEAEMRKKGQVAEGYKSLWEMQRAQSSSDAEARTRVRGFLLDSVKQAVVAHMAQYESALASAQGQAAVAKIDEEFSKNIIDVYHYADQTTTARKNQAIQIWSGKLNNAQESWSNSIKERESNKKDKAPNPLEDLIVNPITKKPIGLYQPGIRPEEKQAYRTKLAGLSDTSNDLRQMMDIVRRNPGRVDLFTDTRFSDTDGQNFDFLRKKVAQSMAKATDGRVAEYEVNGFLQGMRPETLANQGEAEKVLASTSNSWLQQGTSEFTQLGQSLPPEDPRRELSMYNEEPFGPIINENKNIAHPPTKDYAQTRIDDAEKIIKSPYGKQFVTQGHDSDVDTDHAELLKERGINPADSPPHKTAILQYEPEMVKLRKEVESRGPEAKRALDDLQKAALPAFNHVQKPEPEAVFALIQLHHLTTIPEVKDWIANEQTESDLGSGPVTDIHDVVHEEMPQKHGSR